MRISRVRIENFRNFRDLDVRLGAHAVIVGENKVGKSNFLQALRLVLDPSLADAQRQLRPEDFWDGLPRPLPSDAKISVSVDLADFGDNDDQVACLADALVNFEPLTARLTYVFQREELEGEPATATATYRFRLLAGAGTEVPMGWELRRRMPMDFIPALRDAENDLASWRRSPLRPLLTEAVDAVTAEDKDNLAKEVTSASAKAAGLPAIADLSKKISDTLAILVGPKQATNVSLGIAPTDADRLLRTLRLLVDDGLRTVSEASLGVANTLYLALRLLEVLQLWRSGARDHTFLAIEEPEAHLHPHVQRHLYRRLLDSRRHAPGADSVGGEKPATVLLTTHSPSVVSVAPVKSLVSLRGHPVNGTTARSGCTAALTDKEVDDLERYLDATRADLVFARGVLLVEGAAEALLLPRVAQLADMDLDSMGITVCAVGGVTFLPFVKLDPLARTPSGGTACRPAAMG